MEVFCFHKMVQQERRKRPAMGGGVLSCREVGTNARLEVFALAASKLIMQHYENIMAADFPAGR
jgi:hypothetical protein